MEGLGGREVGVDIDGAIIKLFLAASHQNKLFIFSARQLAAKNN
jgi:hypothetical protein